MSQRHGIFSLKSFQPVAVIACYWLAATTCAGQQPGPLRIDKERVAAHGIRHFSGKHIELYTDMPEAEDIIEMTKIFDQAVPQWCDYFGIDRSRTSEWKLSGFLMADRKKFVDAGLWLDELPQFLHGYQLGPQFWLDEQPSLYYRRHLMLHEGTHAFMNLLMGGSGPPWYSEGMAELLACHRWQDEQLTLGYRIASREESPYWGRVKVIQDAVDQGVMPDLKEVLAIKNRAFLRTDSYAWAWAATAFFDGNPMLQERFGKLTQNVRDRSPAFSSRILKDLEPQWREIHEQWQLYLLEMDYGYDLERAAIVYREHSPLTEKVVEITVLADRGWQSTGKTVVRGQAFALQSRGRYQVSESVVEGNPTPWISEPQGITIQYYATEPLGVIQYAIRGDHADASDVTQLSKPQRAARDLKTVATDTGTIFVRINDSPANLKDNSGSCSLKLRGFPESK